MPMLAVAEVSRQARAMVSRVVLACGAFHTMTSDRPFRKAMSAREALEALARNAGAQFRPRTVRALLDLGDPAHPIA